MGNFDDYFSDTINFIANIILSLSEFVMNNKFVFRLVFVPIVASCFIVVIDMFFDIRDLFGYAPQIKDWFPISQKIVYNKFFKKKKKDALNMDEVYQRSKEHADYKHNLKMEESKEFRANEILRHQHKLEEQDNFYKNKQEHDLKIKKMQSALNKHSIPKKPNTKKANLDVEVED